MAETKQIQVTTLKPGRYVVIDGVACRVNKIDTSRPGKHGHAKCRIEAIGLFNGKKKVLAVPGHERFEVPLIDKRKGQVLSVGPDSASVMDLESYETIDVAFQDSVKENIQVEKQVEVWEIEGKKKIMRAL